MIAEVVQSALRQAAADGALARRISPYRKLNIRGEKHGDYSTPVAWNPANS
jgi:hypothetical protein